MPDILDHGPFVTRQQRGSERRAASAIRSLPAHAAALPGAMSSTSDEHQRNETNDNLNRGKIFYTKMVMSDDRQLKPLTSLSFVLGNNTAPSGRNQPASASKIPNSESQREKRCRKDDPKSLRKTHGEGQQGPPGTSGPLAIRAYMVVQERRESAETPKPRAKNRGRW